MIKVKLVQNIGQAAALLSEMGDKIAPDLALAMTASARHARLMAEKHISAETSIKAQSISDWRVVKATPEVLEAKMVVQGYRLPAELFNPKPAGIMGGRTTGGVRITAFGKPIHLGGAFMGDITRMKEPKVMSRHFPKGPGKKRQHRSMPKTYESGGETVRLQGRFPVAHIHVRAVPQRVDDDDFVVMVLDTASRNLVKSLNNRLEKMLKEFSK